MSTIIRGQETNDMSAWKFWIDVGGTFTDVVAVKPDGEMVAHKLLSSGRLKGRIESCADGRRFSDARLAGVAGQFYRGYTFVLLGKGGAETARAKIADFDSGRGGWTLDALLHGVEAGMSYELFSGEPAPVSAIRALMGLRLDQPIGAVDVRLGTTRGTNALLERKGARTAFVTTRGFGDMLLIGTQERPELFKLDIRKPAPLFESVIEVDERIDNAGNVLEPLDRDRARDALRKCHNTGAGSLAICLLNSYRNDIHERAVEALAREAGFEHISVSTRVSNTINFVSRGETTVLDAYLTPVIRRYVAEIQSCMPEAALRLLTSAGGLALPESFSGKDSVLSGPAGGVVGFSHAARAAGFERAIGFDMGGTSTDVSRFDGQFEYQYETRKAGVRISIPMLAVETVAAGGGSICKFDGQKFTVGPESSGADPGPACYGRGGPLSITDIDVFLGKIIPAAFPFALDRGAIEQRVAAVAEDVFRVTGKRMPPREIAEGFTRIADANMAAPIKSISVLRGIDVREYCLVCFGGAGGQHACAVARVLGMSSVLLHPYAGVLSAYGMGLADAKKVAERTVLLPCNARSAAAVLDELGCMEARLRAELAAEGIPHSGVKPPRRLLEVRYVGQSSTITVEDAALPGDAEALSRFVAAEFEQRHRRLYGYAISGRAIEFVTIRLELSGVLAQPATAWREPVKRIPRAARTAPVIFDGREHAAAVFSREALASGDAIDGPALIVESTSTLVIEPGWRAEVTGRGDIVMTAGVAALAGSSGAAAAHATCDPVLLEIFNNQFASIAEQMGNTLRRTALSTNVKERLDFSCAVFTASGDLIANAPHIPVHLGAMSECVKCVIVDSGGVKPGDVFVTNDPYRGGSHLPDVTVVTPVHDAGGVLLFFTASRAHHAEIGGRRPGSMPPDSTRLSEEGVLIRCFRAVERGVSREGDLRTVLASPPYPSRAPDDNIADIRAQIAANRAGANELLAMIAASGSELVLAYMNHIRDAAERKLRAALRRLPAGRYAFKDCMDDGTPVCVAIEVQGDSATVDFTGTGPVVKGNVNANPAIVRSALLYCLRCLIDEDIPLNSGVLAPITLILPECFLNPRADRDPEKCPAIVGGNVETSQRIVDAIFGALKLCAASQGTMNSFAFGDATFGYMETICGGAGAGLGYHGASAVHTHMTNTRLTDPEVLEQRFPVRLRRFAIRKGSGGAGKFRGGDGVIREIEFLKPLEISILSTRRNFRPFGLDGGGPGEAGRNLLRRAGSQRDAVLPALASVEAGDVVTIMTPGGGGYGREGAI
jgi:5-oxoprolinase (ATP-hydrolysing)